MLNSFDHLICPLHRVMEHLVVVFWISGGFAHACHLVHVCCSNFYYWWCLSHMRPPFALLRIRGILFVFAQVLFYSVGFGLVFYEDRVVLFIIFLYLSKTCMMDQRRQKCIFLKNILFKQNINSFYCKTIAFIMIFIEQCVMLICTWHGWYIHFNLQTVRWYESQCTSVIPSFRFCFVHIL